MIVSREVIIRELESQRIAAVPREGQYIAMAKYIMSQLVHRPASEMIASELPDGRVVVRFKRTRKGFVINV